MKRRMDRIFFAAGLLLLSGWLGAGLTVTDFSYRDLNYGRHVSASGELTAPPVQSSAVQRSPAIRGWLGGWSFYRAFTGGGNTALSVLGALSFALGSLLLFLTAPNWAGFAATAAAALIAATWLDLSTALFSWPLAAALVFLFQFARRRSWSLGIIPLLLVAWVCLNRDAAVGLALTGVFVLGEIVRLAPAPSADPSEASRGERWRHFGLLLAAVVSSLGALALLPGGFSNVANPFAAASYYVQAGLPGWGPLGPSKDAAFFAVAALSAWLAGRLPLQKTLARVLALAVATVATLYSGHAVVFWAAVMAWTVPLALSSFQQRGRCPRRRLTLERAVPAALVAFAVPVFAAREAPAHPFERAARFLDEQNLPGPSFHVPEAGGVLCWTLDEDFQAFADLRPSSVRAYEQTAAEGGLPALVLDPGSQEALLSHALARELTPSRLRESGLAVLYFDDDAIVYARPQALPSGVTTLSLFDPFESPDSYTTDALPAVTEELYRYLDHHPGSTLAWTRLGELLLRRERREEALLAFESARVSSPGDAEILLELSRLYLEKEMYGLAEDASRRALDALAREDDPRRDELTYDLALALYRQGRLEESARYFEAVTTASELRSFAAQRYLVDIYRRLQAPDKAIALGERLEAIEATRVGEHLALARRKKLSTDFMGAAAELQEAHEIRPDDADILWELALTLFSLRDEALAADVLRELVEVAPSHAMAHLTLGALCARKLSCDPDEARQHLETFLTLAPTDPNADLAETLLAELRKSSSEETPASFARARVLTSRSAFPRMPRRRTRARRESI